MRLSEVPPLVYFLLRRLGGAGGGFLPELFSETHQRRAMTPAAWQSLSRAPKDAPRGPSVGAADAYRDILLTYLQVYLPGLLIVEDKISMAHSLEARTPFLDNALVDLSLSIPGEVKLHHGMLKAIVKEAARSVLPAELFVMPKRGFPTPLARWLRGPLAGWMRERLTRPDTSLTRLFRIEYLERTCSSYLGSWRRAWRPLDELQTHRMWMLLSLESWLRQYQERAGLQLALEG